MRELCEKVRGLYKEENFEEVLRVFKDYRVNGGDVEVVKGNKLLLYYVGMSLLKTGNKRHFGKFVDMFGIGMKQLGEGVGGCNGDERCYFNWRLMYVLHLTYYEMELMAMRDGAVDVERMVSVYYGLRDVFEQVCWVDSIWKELESKWSDLMKVFMKLFKGKSDSGVQGIRDKLRDELCGGILEWLKLDKLGDEEKVLSGDFGQRVMASNREDVLVGLMKAVSVYDDIGMFEKLELEFKKISRVHYENDVWVMRMKAEILSRLGKYEEVEKLYQRIFKRKKDWFLYGELGDVYMLKGDSEQAKQNYAVALVSKGDMDKKVVILEKMGRLLIDVGEQVTGKKHLMLCKLIRERNQWKVPDRILRLLDGFNEWNEVEDMRFLRERWREWSGWGNGDKRGERKKKDYLIGEVKKILRRDESHCFGIVEVKENGGGMKKYVFTVKSVVKWFDKVNNGVRLKGYVVGINENSGVEEKGEKRNDKGKKLNKFVVVDMDGSSS